MLDTQTIVQTIIAGMGVIGGWALATAYVYSREHLLLSEAPLPLKRK